MAYVLDHILILTRHFKSKNIIISLLLSINMVQVTEKDGEKQIVSIPRMATIEYSCGCSYLFDHHIELKHICSEHESQLTAHG